MSAPPPAEQPAATGHGGHLPSIPLKELERRVHTWGKCSPGNGGQPLPDTPTIDEARQWCSGCPVQHECLAAAVRLDAEKLFADGRTTAQTRDLTPVAGGLPARRRVPMVQRLLDIKRAEPQAGKDQA